MSDRVTSLPIFSVFTALEQALAEQDHLILVAEPGAGKTTQVPLRLKQLPWCSGKVLMFEPRRVAARAAAARLAALLGEAVGNTVGYRMRGDSQISADTQIEVVTGGVLARILIEDPALTHYSALILDEFHERNLDADLSLALALAGQSLFREGPSLKLVVMSATLEVAALQPLLPNAPTLRCEGRVFPITTHYWGNCHLKDIAVNTSAAIMRALADSDGHILAFLPGQRDIEKTRQQLAERLPPQVALLTLYGAMPFVEQQKAIAPLDTKGDHLRKVVLATDLAESSITIDGVSAVVDGGWHRAPVYDARTDMTRLSTQRISAASATQRAGRAGRTGPGLCYRLWSKEQVLNAHTEPDIVQADLVPLAISLAAFGVAHPDELAWVTPPPAHHYQRAVATLVQLGALDAGQLTPHGQALVDFPTHPRLAHMMIIAKRLGEAATGALLAALIHENALHSVTDIDKALLNPRSLPKPVLKTQSLWLRQLGTNTAPNGALGAGELLALAYPDRVAKQIDPQQGLYRLSNGRQARLPPNSPLGREMWLTVAECGGRSGQSEDRIFAAARLRVEALLNELAALTHSFDRMDWRERDNRFVAERVVGIGSLDIKTVPLPKVSLETRVNAIADFVKRKALAPLNLNDEVKTLQARVHWAKTFAPDAWPDYSNEALILTLTQWLTPYLNGVSTLGDLKKLDIASALTHGLTWAQQTQLKQWVPTHIAVPSGSHIRIDYLSSPPVLAVKLQEMFGQETTPTIVDGKLPLVVHLLSPAGRPLQVTQDLAGFWRSSYFEVRKEMKGRYPKHPWPDDPLSAEATRWTKKRSTPNR